MKIIYNKDNSCVVNKEDGTCYKKVDLPKCFGRLENEAKCLKIMNGFIAPKIINYEKENHVLTMEYISGLTLNQYIHKYGKMPEFYFAKLVINLLTLLDNKIEYGADMKYDEHFIIDNDNNVRIIDFGISNIYLDREDIIEYWRNNTIRDFAFVFIDSNIDDVVNSWNERSQDLQSIGISKSILDEYYKNYDKI